jgi:hypothetical protein
MVSGRAVRFPIPGSRFPVSPTSVRRAIALAAVLAAPAAAQTRVEGQLHAVTAVSSVWFAGGGAGVAVRPVGRTRLGVGATGGIEEGEFAVRIEVTASYHLNPYARRGVAPYLTGGAAIQTSGIGTRQYLMVALGFEATPGGRRGMFVEVGVGGGVRGMIGLRFRS